MGMPFGKHKGKRIEDIPEDYLEWLWEKVDLYGELKTAVENALNPPADNLELDIVKTIYSLMLSMYMRHKTSNIERHQKNERNY